MNKIGIIGAGAWGTALATVAARNGLETVIWAREADVAAAINDVHENTTFLPGIALAPEIRAVTSLAEAAAADALLLCVPAQFMRAVTMGLAPGLAASTPVVNCAKGIEQETMALMSDIIAETLPGRPIAVLSGPTFAAEVADGRPTGVTLAAGDETLGRELVAALGSKTFRTYLSSDLAGAQIGGAVKNVLAIACGIVIGRELGENGRAALITRGLTEIVRFGIAKGAEPQSLMGLAGLGDLVLTCTSIQSRNYSLGVALGRGEALDTILKARNSVAEGAFSAAAVTALARKLDIDMPICFAVDEVLNRSGDIDTAIADLLSRPFTTEVI
ncbi:MAG: NAD(P)H-dependent glycerol-3-phosphate dehydrogenase [Alphaproteobacteria bacterium]